MQPSGALSSCGGTLPFFRRIRHAGLCMLVFVCFPACSRQPFQVQTLEPAVVRQILARLESSYTGFATMTGRAKIIIESPEYRQNGMAVISMQYPDSMRMTFEGPLGIDAADFLVSPDTIVFYNRRENTRFQGPYTPNAMRQLAGLHLRLDEVLHLVAGQQQLDARFISGPFTGQRLRDRLVMRGRSGDHHIEIELDSKERYIAQIRWIDDAGVIVQDVEYSRFHKERGYYVPDRIRYQRLGDKRRVLIQFRTRQINRSIEAKNFLIRAPQSARVIKLSDDY
jgi:outer membrane lipoprotein-sorting protein